MHIIIVYMDYCSIVFHLCVHVMKVQEYTEACGLT